jgi:hypothetical protein
MCPDSAVHSSGNAVWEVFKVKWWKVDLITSRGKERSKVSIGFVQNFELNVYGKGGGYIRMKSWFSIGKAILPTNYDLIFEGLL